MGYSSEAARTRTQRSNNANKQIKSNKNSLNRDRQNNNNNKYNCCDNYTSSDSSSLRLLSSEVIFQSSADSDDEKEATHTKATKCRRQADNTTRIIAIKKTQKRRKDVEEAKEEAEKEGEAAESGVEAEETEKQIQIECGKPCDEGVETEAVAVEREERQRCCKLSAAFVNNCTTAVDTNNNNKDNNNNRETHSTECDDACANFHRTSNGNNNCCHYRQLSREQLPQTRVALPPQAEAAEQQQLHQQQQQTQTPAADRNVWWRTTSASLSPPTETAARTTASARDLERPNYTGVKALAARSGEDQCLQEFLQQACSALTERLACLRDNMGFYGANELDPQAMEKRKTVGAGMRTPTEQQKQRKLLESKCQPLQMAYKRGREQKQLTEQQQQKTKQRTVERQQAKQQQTGELKAPSAAQRNALTYCHHQKQKHKQQQQHNHDHQQPQTPFQQHRPQQQQLSVSNKNLKNQPQQQQHHSPQQRQQPQKLLPAQKKSQKPQQQQQQQQKQRHRLRRGIQTVAAAAYGAFSYIGHNYYHLLGNSFSFYAVSSVILALCYLTTTTAAAHSPDKAPFDKHPIQSIDWSKFDESSSDKEILDLLLEKKRYDKRLLPPVNDEDFCCGLSSPDMAKVSNSRRPHNRGTLTVNVNVLLLSLASPDESSLKYEVEFLLNQQWNDPRLQYGNKSHYDFLNALHHHDSIWTPDTYFIMHGDFKDPIIPMHFALRIYRNGTITYAMRRHLILSCQGSLHIFPFDDPKCSFSMESISYEEAQIKYVWKNDEDTLRKSPSLTTLNAYLIKNQTTPCDQNSWRGNYSCLRVDLIFTRDRAFYFTTVFIPGIILVTSSFITFWLEWNAVPARSMIGNYSCLEVELTFTRDRAYYFTTVFIPGIILVTSSFITFWLEWNAVPARVMIGVTTMLNFFTTSNGFRSTLPVVSNLTAMNVWDGVCMCFIYASLLEFVCVNYMGRKRPQHNAVYRPGENPVTQGIIEREFHAALLSEKATMGASSSTTTGTSIPVTPTPMHPYHTDLSTATTQTPLPPSPPPPPTATAAYGMSTVDAPRIRWEEQHGGIIGVAMQNLRARSIRRRTRSPGSATSASSSYADTEAGRSKTPTTTTMSTVIEPVYTEPTFDAAECGANMPPHETTVTVEVEPTLPAPAVPTQQRRSISTNTPPLILSGSNKPPEDESASGVTEPSVANADTATVEMPTEDVRTAAQLDTQGVADASGHLPVKPPRRKQSRSSSPVPFYEQVGQPEAANGHGLGAMNAETFFKFTAIYQGEKRRDVRAPNEIVACTTCGGSSSPCTHSANNGCATETCFVQVRKKEPPHPIRIAKTIDVIARITFPTAYAIFLIFFFVHYKGFS
ncbi:uncharacterized protein LOC105209051 isoform X5 [Zeugodacus cucurbitae]|uniref:uncharacterized protein LOC105209051 isoform X5 n=1 Tax=Zeugodacus cucurbitae TaxID=28588 RepID=UPI0023D912CA|nr:uncharacterized protein LOC105209051 isoform X5 [Zeugodacus cucurbitae]